MKKPFFSVFIPVYNCGTTISETLQSVFNQTFINFEVIISDNNSTDNTLSIIKKFKDKRLIIRKNKTNIGYNGNLNNSLKLCHSDNIFILAGDDLIDTQTLEWYFQAFKKYPKAGAITRPYYWFDNDYKYPVRAKATTKTKHDLQVTIKSSFGKILLVLSSLDQCSGLCFKRNFTKEKFSNEIWVSHAYPWLDIFKKHPVIFLKNYPLAVRIGQSATRTNIYQKSPMEYWKNMINYIFKENSYKLLRERIISEFVGVNYVGLVQIRNYGTFNYYLREIKNLILFRKKNLLNPKFYLWVMLTLFTPPFILRKLSDYFKSHINHQIISPSIIIKL